MQPFVSGLLGGEAGFLGSLARKTLYRGANLMSGNWIFALESNWETSPLSGLPREWLAGGSGSRNKVEKILFLFLLDLRHLKQAVQIEDSLTLYKRWSVNTSLRTWPITLYVGGNV